MDKSFDSLYIPTFGLNNFADPHNPPLGDGGNMKYTQSTLDRIEKVLEESGYVLRYERGTFQSGYCILEDRKVVVLNKYLTTEGRINTLIDIIPQITIDPDALTPDSKKTHIEIMSNQKSDVGGQE